MELGQMIVSILNGIKEMMGANWQQYYCHNVDIRYREILQNTFSFY